MPKGDNNTKGYNRIWQVFARPVRWLLRLRTVNPEKLPAEGGCILCANHTSLLDVLILSASTGRQICYMAKAELFKIPLLKQLISFLGAFPVNRKGVDVASIKKTIALLGEGAVVGIFPQGTRHGGKNPAETPVKNGVGMIAYHAKATVVPAFIRAKNNRVRLFRKTELILGDPIPFEALGLVNGGRAEYEAATEKIFTAICALGGYDRPADKGATK